MRRHFPLTSGVAREPDLTIVFDRPAPVGAPQRPPDLLEGSLRAWLEAEGMVGQHASGLLAVVTESSIEIGGDVTPEAMWQGFRQLIQLALSWTLARQNRALIHAAAVARGDEAIVVLGESGKGKSTLAGAALDAGWKLLGDDLLIVDSTGATPIVTAVPKPPALPIGTQLAPSLDDSARPRKELPHSVLTFGDLRVRGSLQVEWSEEQGFLGPLPAHDLMQWVFDSALVLEDPAVSRVVLPAAAALARLPAFVLAHDARSDVRQHVAVELLEQAWSRMGEPSPVAT